MSDVALDYRADYRKSLFGTRTTTHPSDKYLAQKEDYVARFYRLVRVWREDTATSSQLQEVLDHPAFGQIVNIGPPAIPLIVRELRLRPDFLFVALQRITHDDPVPPGCARPSEMVEAWLAWAEMNNDVPPD